jgi:segregation and condensation protein B
LSLDELSQTFAQLIGRGDDPYAAQSARERRPGDPIDATEPIPTESAPEPVPGSDCCQVTPRSILEAMLFVGHPENVALSAAQVASMMRGVTAGEIHELVNELNDSYHREGSPLEIKSVGGGYRMTIRDAYASLRANFYGKIRQARLSQAAIDVLAIVAYHQPISREDVDQLRGKPSGALLRQLVRRQLLRIDRSADKPRITRFWTTERFLDLFGLDQIDDLPQSQDIDKD